MEESRNLQKIILYVMVIMLATVLVLFALTALVIVPWLAELRELCNGK